ncbi:MAG: energy transducer TonB [Candidatus Muiribacteriaceae bacterium]
MSAIMYKAEQESFSPRIFIISVIAGLILVILVPFFNTLDKVGREKKKVYRMVEFDPITEKTEKKDKKVEHIRKSAEPRPVNMKQKLTPVAMGAQLPSGPTIYKGDFTLDPGFIDSLEPAVPVFSLNEVDKAPVAVTAIPPEYPVIAKDNGLEGQVLLQVYVSETGEVTDVEVLRSEPGEVFVRSSVACVKRWKFRPAVRNGENVSVKVEIPLKFSLED